MDPTLILAAIQAVSGTTEKIIDHEKFMMENMSPEKRTAYADAWGDPRIWWQSIMNKFGDLLDGSD